MELQRELLKRQILLCIMKTLLLVDLLYKSPTLYRCCCGIDTHLLSCTVMDEELVGSRIIQTHQVFPSLCHTIEPVFQM